MNTKETTNEQDRFKERYRFSFQGWFYSVQRFDVLLISVSGGGLYLSLETLKYVLENQYGPVWPVKLAGVMFVLAIILNLISQLTGKKANFHDLIWTEEIVWGSNKRANKELIKKHDYKAEYFSVWTRSLNLTALASLLIGLASLMLYTLIIF